MITPDKIIRSNRRTLSIIVNKRAEIIVRAPIRCSDRRIFDFINKQENWIKSKVNEIKSMVKTLTIVDDEVITIMGEQYTIRLTDKSRIKLDGSFIYIPRQDSHNRLINFLKKLAREYLAYKVAVLAKRYNFTYKSIKITSAKTRWGSCTADNSINFTYRLMLAPVAVIDYIIIHELSHTLVKNHSKTFYNLVASIMPDYKICERWLKQNRAIIELI